MKLDAKRGTLTLLIIVVVLGIPATIFGLKKSLSTSSLKSAITVSTTHQPEKITELFFSDYSRLTKVLIPGTVYSGKFSIVNHQAEPLTYVYEVITTIDGKLVSTTKNQVLLKDGQTTEQAFSYGGYVAGSKINVSIKLLNVKQTIYLRANT